MMGRVGIRGDQRQAREEGESERTSYCTELRQTNRFGGDRWYEYRLENLICSCVLRVRKKINKDENEHVTTARK